ncbi:MAG TPA: AbrB/MazE/SpoVT family DNA-binding domain-containing protein [Armatimonadota bacterium]|nr:AbrB/MazE/SpoVT family DNA-binding domain-containing protein [Armatimonadota bacterium]
MDKSAQDLEQFFYGSATIGERGQIVIPAEARKDCDIHSGDKLLVFRHPMHPNILILARIADMQQIQQQLSRASEVMTRQLEAAESNEPK